MAITRAMRATRITRETRGKVYTQSLRDTDGVDIIEISSDEEPYCHSNSEDEEGIEYEDESASDIAEEPPSRRTRSMISSISLSANTANLTSKESPFQARSNHETTLGVLPKMPLEVLYGILSYLMPKDILAMTRTSKNFCQILLSTNASRVWKEARERLQMPSCPYWMSEFAWAGLFFGNTCQVCDAKNIHKVDFMILSLVVRSKIPSRLPQVDDVTLHFVVYTNVGPNSGGKPSTSQFYWDTDVESMALRLATRQRTHQGPPDAEKRLEKFRNERIARLSYLHEHHRLWKDWLDDYRLQKQQEENAKQTRRIEQIKQRFMINGYEEEDITFLDDHEEGKGKAEVTDKVWERIRRKLEPQISERRKMRLATHSADVRVARCSIIQHRYSKYKKAVHPSQWKYFPPTLAVTLLKPFRTIVEKDPTAAIPEEVYDNLHKQLPELLVMRADKSKARLVDLLTTNTYYNQTEAPPPDAINLVTSVFRCSRSHAEAASSGLEYHYLFGWDDIATHYCNDDDYAAFWGNCGRYAKNPESTFKQYRNGHKLIYDPLAVEVVERVVKLLGLLPRMTTVRDMDQKTERFSCAKCEIVKERGSQAFRWGYDWRGLVAHLTEDESHNPDLAFTILSPADAQSVMRYESVQARALWGLPQWSCARCSTHVDNLVTRCEVIKHLQQSYVAIFNSFECFKFHDVSPLQAFDLHPCKRGRLCVSHAMPTAHPAQRQS
ncbi:hypothetical protein BXZ70DRAFT_715126 [Cristinia sonorae]|uniref:F-box domain-containing protein n=1 Tax=Cristinia sonorae TaxID=1940300 RepID=A0A8K0USF5_9AGAR|nr:hypothetical protein BXZ70DRAFT_715126 [Cristinia sonorae]